MDCSDDKDSNFWRESFQYPEYTDVVRKRLALYSNYEATKNKKNCDLSNTADTSFCSKQYKHENLDEVLRKHQRLCKISNSKIIRKPNIMLASSSRPSFKSPLQLKRRLNERNDTVTVPLKPSIILANQSIRLLAITTYLCKFMRHLKAYMNFEIVFNQAAMIIQRGYKLFKYSSHVKLASSILKSNLPFILCLRIYTKRMRINVIIRVLHSAMSRIRSGIKKFIVSVTKAQKTIRSFLLVTKARIELILLKWAYLEHEARYKYEEQQLKYVIHLKDILNRQIRDGVGANIEGKLDILKTKSTHLTIIMDRILQQFNLLNCSPDSDVDKLARVKNNSSQAHSIAEYRKQHWKAKYFHIGTFKVSNGCKKSFNYFEHMDELTVRQAIHKCLLAKRKKFIERMDSKRIGLESEYEQKMSRLSKEESENASIGTITMFDAQELIAGQGEIRTRNLLLKISHTYDYKSYIRSNISNLKPYTKFRSFYRESINILTDSNLGESWYSVVEAAVLDDIFIKRQQRTMHKKT